MMCRTLGRRSPPQQEPIARTERPTAKSITLLRVVGRMRDLAQSISQIAVFFGFASPVLEMKRRRHRLNGARR